MNQCSCLVQRVRLEARPLAWERVGVAVRMRRAVGSSLPHPPPYITSLLALRECKATTVGSLAPRLRWAVISSSGQPKLFCIRQKEHFQFPDSYRCPKIRVPTMTSLFTGLQYSWLEEVFTEKGCCSHKCIFRKKLRPPSARAYLRAELNSETVVATENKKEPSEEICTWIMS